jgi:DNA-binding winged helix-turn-helix (wHTH) protein
MQRASNSLNDTSEPRLIALRFGPFELDVRSGELRRNGTTVRLQPQPLKVLLLLAGRPGEVVTREEIQAEIWPAGTFVDFEQSLNFCIRQIRAALRDDANAPRYVETLPRRGYRWVAGPVQSETQPAQVREWPRPIAAESPAPLDASSGGVSAAVPVARASRSWPVALALFAGLLLVALALSRQKPQAAATPSFQRITFRRGALNSARFAPDGQVVYSAAWDGGPRELHVTQADGRESRTLEIKDAQVVGVSSSGEVAFLQMGVLARAPLAGGPAKEMLKEVGAADWTADGRDFALTRWVGAKTKLEFPVGHVLTETPAKVNRLRISPDRRYVAYTEHPVLGDDRGLVAVVDQSGRRVATSPEWASLEGLAWAPGGREVYFTAAESGADNSLRGLSLDGKVRLVLSGTGRFVLHDTAPDGRILLERATLRSEIQLHTGGSGEDRDLSWLDFSAVEGISPNGDTVLFFESGEGGGPEYTSFLRKTDGSPPVRLGNGRALDLSPDGRFVISVDIRNASALDLTPTGPGEIRHVRVPGLVAHEDAGFLADSTRIYVTGRDASGNRATWLTDVQGRAARPLPLPEGRILRSNTFSADGSRFVASCPEGNDGSCFYDTLAGKPVPVPGAQKEWVAIGIDKRGRLYYRDRAKNPPESLLRLEPVTGRVTKLAELAPRDRAGVFSVLDANIAADGEAWAYTFQRRLSDLHIVSGVK